MKVYSFSCYALLHTLKMQVSEAVVTGWLFFRYLVIGGSYNTTRAFHTLSLWIIWIFFPLFQLIRGFLMTFLSWNIIVYRMMIFIFWRPHNGLRQSFFILDLSFVLLTCVSCAGLPLCWLLINIVFCLMSMKVDFLSQ